LSRYPQAAVGRTPALDWAISNVRGIRRTEISNALAKNRSFIRRRLA
jgi:hypothetical protein